ncbi:MAG: VanZ family protein [Flavobacteriaceae bacterium]|nr:VanZ family protein [Bacteroidia bacterium]NNL15016.1 VanZ family protein [Flavobacteriaceae bacterium]
MKESISIVPRFDYIDKIFHASAYVLLTYICSRYIMLSKPSYSLTKILIIAALFLTLYGIVIEVLQTTLTENRVGEFEDVLANFSGIILGSFIFRYLSSRILL